MTEEQLQSKHCDYSRGTSKGARILRNIGEVSKYFPFNEPVLCIGCGDGLEVDIWRLLGYEAIGIEIDSEKAKYSKFIYQTNIYDYKPEKKYNIYCAHTLEHLKNINLALNLMYVWHKSTICIIVPIEPNGTKNPSHHSPIKTLKDINLDIKVILCNERWNDELEGIKVWKD